MNRVDGKVALVSGAAQGIGRRVAELLAECGAKVMLTDIDEAGGAEAVKAIEAAGGTARFAKHDVTSEEQWAAVVDECVAELGGLDVLVNNAGIFFYAPIEAMTLEQWQHITHVNLDGVFLGTKHGIRGMNASEPNGGRSIINLSSIAGIVGGPLVSAYNMTKGGVRLFTKATALECAALGYGIRVNSVHPGVIETSMGNQVTGDILALDPEATEESAMQSIIDLHPLGRLGTADEVARAIVFLASDDSSFMTGSELVVDGGLTAK